MLRFQLSTFIFQVVNFFILLAVLTRFFYRPLQQAMKRQEDEITARVREAQERAPLPSPPYSVPRASKNSPTTSTASKLLKTRAAEEAVSTLSRLRF